MFMWLLIGVVFVVIVSWLVHQSSARKTQDLDPPSVRRKKRQAHASIIKDRYKSLDQVQLALRQAGLESSNLIIAIDYSKSNEYNGMKSFNGMCLHSFAKDVSNPYQEVISIIGRTLEAFDQDKRIPVFGFGDQRTTAKRVFPFNDDERPCYGFNEVLERYNDITPMVLLSGPTSFAPVIRKAIEIVKMSNNSYHILVIIADGEVTKAKETKDLIVEASSYPLSIVVVGVGDGPFDLMETFDDGLPKRKFDNFQFVDYNEIVGESDTPDVEFALRALMEIPEQFKSLRRLHMLG